MRKLSCSTLITNHKQDKARAKTMIYFNLKNCKIIEATKSSGSKYWIEHPQNDVILASCDTKYEAEQIVEGFNNFPEAMKRTMGLEIK